MAVNDLRDGFLVGKQARISEWSAKKEKQQTDKLVATLRATKWNRAHPDRKRQLARECHRRHKDEYNARKRDHDRKAPRTRACDWCGQPYELPYPHPRGGIKRTCSAACRHELDNANARREQAAKRSAAGRRVTACTRCGEPGHNRRTCPTAKGGFAWRRVVYALECAHNCTTSCI